MKQKTIVITGSTSGIGFGLAKEFLALGHKVVINGRAEEKLSKALSELQNINPNVIGVVGSVSLNKTHVSIVEKATSEFGKIDIWVNNAGIPQAHKIFVDIDDTELKEIIDTNIYGLMLGVRIAAKHMIQQGFGKIFNMEGFGSDGRTMRKLSIYGTTKRAVNYYTKSIANEIKDFPVQIGVLSPGMVRTEFLNSSKEFMSGDEAKKFEKVYKALAEDVEPVTKYLVQRILKSSKNYDRIEYLTKTKLILKLIKMMMS